MRMPEVGEAVVSSYGEEAVIVEIRPLEGLLGVRLEGSGALTKKLHSLAAIHFEMGEEEALRLSGDVAWFQAQSDGEKWISTDFSVGSPDKPWSHQNADYQFEQVGKAIREAKERLWELDKAERGA